MSRLTPQHWKKLEQVFLLEGFVFVRQESSHRAYEKDGVLRPAIIPTYNEVGVDIIKGLIKTAGINRTRYLELLNKA